MTQIVNSPGPLNIDVEPISETTNSTLWSIEVSDFFHNTTNCTFKIFAPSGMAAAVDNLDGTFTVAKPTNAQGRQFYTAQGDCPGYLSVTFRFIVPAQDAVVLGHAVLNANTPVQTFTDVTVAFTAIGTVTAYKSGVSQGAATSPYDAPRDSVGGIDRPWYLHCVGDDSSVVDYPFNVPVQVAGITDPVGGATVDNEARAGVAALNVLARAHGWGT